jgi:hypothetical protein
LTFAEPSPVRPLNGAPRAPEVFLAKGGAGVQTFPHLNPAR